METIVDHTEVRDLGLPLGPRRRRSGMSAPDHSPMHARVGIARFGEPTAQNDLLARRRAAQRLRGARISKAAKSLLEVAGAGRRTRE
jgi:hypothetical protein